MSSGCGTMHSKHQWKPWKSSLKHSSLTLLKPRKERDLTVQGVPSWRTVGVALLQNGRPVTYASQALSAAETQYAQIKKEHLQIDFACERFEPYVYRWDMIRVKSDTRLSNRSFQSLLTRHQNDFNECCCDCRNTVWTCPTRKGNGFTWSIPELSFPSRD